MPTTTTTPAPGDDQGKGPFQARTRNSGVFREEVASEVGWFCPHCGAIDNQEGIEEGHVHKCSKCKRPFYCEVSKLYISRSLEPVYFSNQN